MGKTKKEKSTVASEPEYCCEQTLATDQSQIKIDTQKYTVLNRDCAILFAFLLLILIAFFAFLGYSIYTNLERTNLKLQKIQHRFDKFLYYINYIYKSQKNKQKSQSKESNGFTDFFSKITANSGNSKPKQQYQSFNENRNKKQNVVNKKQLNNQKKQIKQSLQKERKKIKQEKQKYRSKTNDEMQLLSQQQIYDIALKIIQQNNIQSTCNADYEISNKQQDKQESQKGNIEKVKDNILSGQQKSEPFFCQIDKQNQFTPSFEYKPDKKTLRKTTFTYNHESIICQQPLPRHGTYEISIKIVQTYKNYIYIGIAGGQKNKIYNITSIHQNSNYYGYSGYSGRIWQGRFRRNAYKMFKNNDIFKIKVNAEQYSIQYYLNGENIGESNYDTKLCEKQCRFVIEMYNQGDQIQFLEPYSLSVADIREYSHNETDFHEEI